MEVIELEWKNEKTEYYFAQRLHHKDIFKYFLCVCVNVGIF